VIPLGSGSAEQLRHGKAFWEILDEQNVPNYVYRIPANFPPIAAKGKTLSAWARPICAAHTARLLSTRTILRQRQEPSRAEKWCRLTSRKTASTPI